MDIISCAMILLIIKSLHLFLGNDYCIVKTSATVLIWHGDLQKITKFKILQYYISCIILLCHAEVFTVAKIKICQCSLITSSPNLMLTNASHYTDIRICISILTMSLVAVKPTATHP